MVLFKRKPVRFLPPAEIEDEDAEVWYIQQTGEIFATYEDYLARMDFYKQRRFNDQITGHSGLTFFEAYTSERAGGQEVEASFPEALKGPILRKVQFQIISRLDNLVDVVFEEFKHDYFPGEEVTVSLEGGERTQGLVRDKTSFGPRVLPDGTKARPMTRYLVNLNDTEEEKMVTDEQIGRERGTFTKAMLRSYLKRTVIREAWNGAPWLVKNDYALQYHIDTKIPSHLRYDTKLQERKQLQAQKRQQHNASAGLNGDSPNGPVRLPDLKPAPKSHKAKHLQNGAPAKGIKWPLGHGGNSGMTQASWNERKHAPKEPTPPPAPPPPKYPIEDLALEPRSDVKRPQLGFMCRDPPSKTAAGTADETTDKMVDMESVGPLLETWDTLNVYCEIFKLDSFTFDDFVEAMIYASEKMPVQLFDEIHCSVLKILVDSAADGGKVRINLPELDEDVSDEEEDDEDEEEEEEEREATEDPDSVPPARATRRSLAKAEAYRLAAEAEEEERRLEQETRHRAEELLKDYDWVDELRKREFPNGGWERMMVGLLHQLSKNPRQEAICEELLLLLVPPEIEPTQETVREQYLQMDVNHRVKALQLICMLTTETKAVRGYMDDCSETMTKYRKERIEWQRQRKQAIEDLRQLHEQRRTLMPESVETKEEVKEEEVHVNGVEATPAEKEEDDDETEDDSQSRRKRRRSNMDSKKKRELELERKEKEKKEKEAAKVPKQSKELIKVLKDIQKKEEHMKSCEEEIATIENDLREADCPRTRVLGKDRFWNRYYWFERNGMPYGGLPDSSTADAGFANGRIWVQGPDDMEREGYIDLPADLQNEYKAKFNMTVPERKALEEGGTSVHSARQWGYIADPEQVDELIKWLDPRGFNELKLRKELVNFRDRIVSHMENRQKYVSKAREEQEKAERRDESKRTSSRIRDKTPEPVRKSFMCLQWENTMAMEELGRLHSDPPPPPPRARKSGGGRKREAEEVIVGKQAKKRRG